MAKIAPLFFFSLTQSRVKLIASPISDMVNYFGLAIGAIIVGFLIYIVYGISQDGFGPFFKGFGNAIASFFKNLWHLVAG
jgi:F0F1-type ATP synthase membrane subunit a